MLLSLQEGSISFIVLWGSDSFRQITSTPKTFPEPAISFINATISGVIWLFSVIDITSVIWWFSLADRSYNSTKLVA